MDKAGVGGEKTAGGCFVSTVGTVAHVRIWDSREDIVTCEGKTLNCPVPPTTHIPGRRSHLPRTLPAFPYLRLGARSAHDQRSLPRPISPPSPLSSSPSCFPTLRPTTLLPLDPPTPFLSLVNDDGLRRLWLRKASISLSPLPLHLGNHHCRTVPIFRPSKVPHLRIATPSGSRTLPQSSPQTRLAR